MQSAYVPFGRVHGWTACDDGDVSSGPNRDCRAVVLHGAGSTGTTAQVLLGPLLKAAGLSPRSSEYWEDRSGDVKTVSGRVSEWLRATALDDQTRILCGISLGAHALVLALASTPRPFWPDAALVALPAWTGAPDATARLTAAAAEEIAADGADAALARIRALDDPLRTWVVVSLERDWTRYPVGELVEALDRASMGCGPTLDEIRTVDLPVVVLSLPGDPFHPEQVASEWARLLPAAALVSLDPHSLAMRGDFADPRAVRHLIRIREDLTC